jgi:hypothetical protein
MGECRHKWQHQTRPWCLSFWMCSECEMELTDNQYGALEQSRQQGRAEALNAVFQTNGPSRAIAQLKKKWGIDQ